MSLEAVIQENTAALQALAKLFAGFQGGGLPSAAHAAVPAKVAGQAPVANAQPAADPAPKVATLEEVKPRFLQLVNKNRDKALDILKTFNVNKLSDIPAKDLASALVMVNAEL